MNQTGLFADIFHDVDFAALGPAYRRNIVAQHPECGPHSLPRGNLDAGLEAAVGLREQALSLESRGRELARDVVGTFDIFLARGDD
jgi:hypothetical protein